MWKKIAVLSVPAILLSGCSIQDVAQAATDAAACTALQSTLNGLSDAYQAGLVDTGIVDEVSNLVNEQLGGLLSSGLAEDLSQLGTALGESNTGESAKQSVESLTSSIAERCSAVGVAID